MAEEDEAATDAAEAEACRGASKGVVPVPTAWWRDAVDDVVDVETAGVCGSGSSSAGGAVSLIALRLVLLPSLLLLLLLFCLFVRAVCDPSTAAVRASSCLISCSGSK